MIKDEIQNKIDEKIQNLKQGEFMSFRGAQTAIMNTLIEKLEELEERIAKLEE